MLWTKLNVQYKKINALGDIVEKIFPDSSRVQYIVQFLVFVILGGLVGVVCVGPYTQAQAVAGGIAWSRLAAKD